MLILDTDKDPTSVDPLAALEKTTEAKKQMETVQKPRIESLQNLSEKYNSDPYSLSLKARKQFREVKKIEQKKRKTDELLKDRYALPATLSLLEDDDTAVEDAKIAWQKAREDHDLQESKRTKTGVHITSIPSAAMSSRSLSKKSRGPKSETLSSLRAQILRNTAKRSSVIHSTASSSSNLSRPD